MPATTIDGNTNAQFGLDPEAGMIASSVSISSQSQKAEVMDEDGDIVAVAYYGKTSSVSVSGTYTGTVPSGPGSTLVLANDAGVSGTILIDSYSVEYSNDGFATVNVEATAYPELS